MSVGVVSCAIAVSSGSTNVDIPTTYPSINRLLGAYSVSFASSQDQSSSSIQLNGGSISISSYEDRKVEFVSPTQQDIILFLVYVPNV